jgi:aryl-alcohol dehydrogenase-like predicted oxidoreductase/predicted kinase
MWRDRQTLVGMGAMRLSTEPARDDERSLVPLHAAFDAGLTLIDTADAYALDASEIGHNERLIARALAAWQGDRSRITVVTKGGLTRPDGRWVPNGRARHLRAACEASCRALAVSRIPLYQLHAPDPRVAWTTSVRALADLRRDQLIDAAGLCNTTVRQIEAARGMLPIATVQVELSPWKDRHIASGVVDYCLSHGITVLAFRPFGGVAGMRRVASDRLLGEVAAVHGVSPFAVVLAWLRGLAPHIVPLPGPTREETARDCVRGQRLTLSDAEQTALDRHFPTGRFRTPAPRVQRRLPQPGAAAGDIVMVMGLPGAGKTTFTAELVAGGYERLNRDEIGGSLAALLPRLSTLLDQNAGRIVLDNTYLSRAARAAVIELAARYGRAVRGVWLDTSIEEAQVNVVWRMVQVYGRLPTSEELKAGRAGEVLSPSALFRAQREVEPPDSVEGFESLEVVPFVRRHDPARTNRAVVIWCDGVIRPAQATGKRDMPAIDESTLDARGARLAQYQADGWRILAIAWEPAITERGVDAAEVEMRFAHLRERLRLDIDFHYCPHGSGPPVCWCRKPLPGLGVLLAQRHQLDVRQCIYVGATPQDPPFARRLGFTYQHADEFFK